MQIPVAVMEQVREYEKNREENERLKKKHVLFLALSTLRIDKNTREIEKSRLICKDELIGDYYYQLEPIVLYLKNKIICVDYIVMLGTDATNTKYDFIVDGKEKNESAESYFTGFIRNELGDNTKIISVQENNTDVETVKAVINKLREIKESEKDITLSIDLHGGFRNTQMLIQSIITLLQYENILPSEIYSIVYDEGSRTGEIVFAKDTYDINNYLTGMSEFLSFGRSKSLELYYKDRDREFTDLIKEISDSIQLCHILRFDNAIKKMNDYIDNYQEKGDYNDLFISSIESSYGDLMDKKGRNKVVNKVKWCVENDFIQQALTIIESQMPKEFLQRNVISYKTDGEQKVKLYQEDVQGGLNEISGGIILEDAIEYKKPDWETTINYSIIPWIRENCCDKVEGQKGKTIYVDRIEIAGDSAEKYYNIWIDNNCLSQDCIIRGVDYHRNVIKLGFALNPKLKDKDRRNLARLFMLHNALKNERNGANHASSKARAFVDEVKTAILAYISLSQKIFDVVS